MHPAHYTEGCIIVTEPLRNSADVTNWELENPKWKEITKIMDNGPRYGTGYAGGSFIGRMVVHE